MTTEANRDPFSRRYDPPLMSWEEYLAFALRQERRFEWVDGEIVEIDPDSTRHLLVVRFVFLLIHEHVEQHRLGLTFFSGPLMQLPRRPSGRVPDVTFVATQRLSRLFDTYLEGPVDLAVDVIAVHGTRRGYGEKLADCEAAGVREYWLIDAVQMKAWFYVQSATGQYQEVTVDADGIYTSTVLPGLRLKTDWLWQDWHPTVAEALAEFG